MTTTIQKSTRQHPDYSMLPSYMRPGMRRYIENGAPPAHFLRAVLENNFMKAVCLADATNAQRLRDYAQFLYNEAPRGSYGSSAAVQLWIESHREEKREKQ